MNQISSAAPVTRTTATQVSATIVLLGIAVWVFGTTMASPYGQLVGYDFGHYLDATRRWMDTGTPYLAEEVAAPFDYAPLTYLHPPVALLLFAPFMVLPAPLWWVIPLALVAWCVWGWRPAPWTWPLMALALAWPRFTGALIVGNTDMWAMAILALGLRFGYPMALLLIKPTLAPFGVLSIRDRRAWIGGFVMLAVCIPFGTLWLDWLAVGANAPGGIEYSIPSAITVALPAFAWVGRTRS